MGTKRQFEEVDAQDGASGKRQKSYVGRKRMAQEDAGAKKRARAIERTLRRNQDLPANVRSDLERELAAQKQMVEDKAYKKKRSTMISRYHMVRFFERKKASRLAKQLKRNLELESDASKAEDLRKDLHIAEVDEAYTLYFPHLETYVGLYSASAKSTTGDQTEEEKLAAAKAALKAERPPMWAVVEKALAEGPVALQRLRDRRSPTDSGDSRPPIRPPPPAAPTSTPASRPVPAQKLDKRDKQLPGKKSVSSSDSYNNNSSNSKNSREDKDKQPEMNRRERRRLMREAMTAAKNDDDDEEGGGFFEGL